jgi:hypothetical protein
MASSFTTGLRLWTAIARRIIPQWCGVGPTSLAQAPAFCGNRHTFSPLSFSIIIRCTHSSAVVSNYRKQLATQEGANEFLSSLSETQRSHLGSALVREEERENGRTEVMPPSWKQLRLLCYQNMLPFIGFGFLDNFIMITVADRIQETMGVMFCLTTMAAAGMGNMVSDLAGLGLADRVDALCRSLGIPDPQLTSPQLSLTSSRWMSLLGRCVGIVVGCFLGMCPLLWIHTHERDHAPQSSSSNQDQ